ncbi:hypothetical protein ABZ845_25340 [Streptomyces sp. NPDC047022]|uniref:hypothetical protein n=1 Tax=Streptomyces sp. NPDC047022 TaxID=3155737 RepID=UPI0033CE93E4
MVGRGERLGPHLGAAVAQGGVQQGEGGFAVCLGLAAQQAVDDRVQRLAVVHAVPVDGEFAGGQQAERGIVVGIGPRLHGGQGDEERGQSQRRGSVRAEQRAGLDGGAGEIHPAEGNEQFGPDTGIGLGRPPAPQGDRGGLGTPGVAERPGGEQPDVHVFMCQQRCQERDLGGNGGPDGARRDLPFVIALGQPAEQAENFGRPGPGGSGDPGQVWDGVHAGGVHRALVEDARVQLGDRLLGIPAALGEGAQQVGKLLGGAVGVRDGGPGVVVEADEGVSEIHGRDPRSRVRQNGQGPAWRSLRHPHQATLRATEYGSHLLGALAAGIRADDGSLCPRTGRCGATLRPNSITDDTVVTAQWRLRLQDRSRAPTS